MGCYVVYSDREKKEEKDITYCHNIQIEKFLGGGPDMVAKSK